MRERPTLSPDDPRHGTFSAYTYWRCRCDRCRRANAEKQLEWKRRQGVMPLSVFKALIKPPPHGSKHRYSRHACRCRICLDGERDRKRAERAKRRSQVHA